MAIVVISKSLEKEVNKRLKNESKRVFELMLQLEQQPKKGKSVGHIGSIQIKEIKYKKFRFYFVTDYYRVKYLSVEELKNLIIKFVRMSDKKDQQIVIDQIKDVLRHLDDY